MPELQFTMGFSKMFKLLSTTQSSPQVSPMLQCGLTNYANIPEKRQRFDSAFTEIHEFSKVMAIANPHFVSESYRKALEQFIDRRRSCGVVTETEFIIYPSAKQNDGYFSKKDNSRKRCIDWKLRKRASFIPGVPHVYASEIFEIGYVAGTEDRYLEMVSAEWHNTRVSLKRHTHPACQGAIRADIEVLTEIRHPNVLLLMATTHTDEYGLVSIFEPVHCTLYNYVHEQGQRISTQGIARVGMKLADALKYCHTRGYIHGAISSHCVYFASNDVIKLGGWEMAQIMTSDTVQFDYEECLRTEIFKWQAPEFFHGAALSAKSDVYGLSLLIWEMSTTRVPWHGCNRPHVERQYANRKRGIAMDLRNLPARLKQILENGLQIDVTKRTLDIDRIRRHLHRLLIFEEEEEAKCTNIHRSDNGAKNFFDSFSATSVSPTSPSENVALIRKSQSNCHMMEERQSNQFHKSKKIQCNRDLDPENNIKKKDTFLINNNAKGTAESQTTPCDCAKTSNISVEREIDKEKNSVARSNIKRLKEIIANRREQFFNGNNRSMTESSLNSYCQTPGSKNTITLSRTNSNPDYILCKPASHATNMELKYRKSPGEYEGTITKSSCVRKRSPYTGVPESVRDAVLQRKVLHSDPQSFYESTLWRKEKLICLSRMGRYNKEEEKIQSLSQGSATSANYCTDNEKTQYSEPNSANDTFTMRDTSEVIEDSHIEDNEELLPKDLVKDHTSMKVLASPDQSLQNLKDALDRAAEIVLSTSSHDVCSSSHLQTYNFNASINNMQKYESTFEDLYGTKNDGSNQEIKDIERSTPGNKSFLGMDEYTENTKNSIEGAIKYEEKFDKNSFIHHDTHTTCTSDSEFIAEISNDFQMSVQNQQLEDLQTSNQSRRVCTNRITSTPRKTKTTREDFKLNEKEFIDVDTTPLQPNNIARCKNCNSCLSRRRSLPAKLNQLKIMPNPNLGKIYAHRRGLQDNNSTIEDLYIDDEFGSHLNDNLVLLNDDLQSDDSLYNNEKLSETTDL